MITYSQYANIHRLRHEKKLHIARIAAEMSLDEKTVAKWLARKRFDRRKGQGRSSKLDPHKPLIKSRLEKHSYSAQQIFQLLCEEGFSQIGEDYRGVSEGRANGVDSSVWMELFFKEVTVTTRTFQV